MGTLIYYWWWQDLALPFQKIICQHPLMFKMHVFLNSTIQNLEISPMEMKARKCQDLYIRVFTFANTYKMEILLCSKKIRAVFFFRAAGG